MGFRLRRRWNRLSLAAVRGIRLWREAGYQPNAALCSWWRCSLGKQLIPCDSQLIRHMWEFLSPKKMFGVVKTSGRNMAVRQAGGVRVLSSCCCFMIHQLRQSVSIPSASSSHWLSAPWCAARNPRSRPRLETRLRQYLLEERKQRCRLSRVWII